MSTSVIIYIIGIVIGLYLAYLSIFQCYTYEKYEGVYTKYNIRVKCPIWIIILFLISIFFYCPIINLLFSIAVFGVREIQASERHIYKTFFLKEV